MSSRETASAWRDGTSRVIKKPQVRRALTILARSMPPEELARRAFHLYEKFRRAVPLGLVVLLSAPICGFGASFYIGLALERAYGGGLWTIFGVTFAGLLFLSVYVWEPTVRPAIFRVSEILRGPPEWDR